jgi:hypothetical protein
MYIDITALQNCYHQDLPWTQERSENNTLNNGHDNTHTCKRSERLQQTEPTQTPLVLKYLLVKRFSLMHLNAFPRETAAATPQ